MTAPPAATISPYAAGLEVVPAVIAASGSLAAAVSLAGKTLVGIQIPSGWTTANLTFQAAYDGLTFVEMYDAAGNEITVVVAAASVFIPIDPSLWKGVVFVKVRSGTSGSAVTQSGGATIELIVCPVI